MSFKTLGSLAHTTAKAGIIGMTRQLANTVFSPLHRELPCHPDDPCLGRRMRQ